MIWPIKKKSDGQIASLPPGKIRIKDKCYGCFKFPAGIINCIICKYKHCTLRNIFTWKILVSQEWYNLSQMFNDIFVYLPSTQCVLPICTEMTRNRLFCTFIFVWHVLVSNTFKVFKKSIEPCYFSKKKSDLRLL